MTIFGAEVDPCYPYHYWDHIEPSSLLECAQPKKKLKASKYYKSHGIKNHNMAREHEIWETWAAEGKITLN